MRDQLMVETRDGWIPNPDLYDDLSNGLFYLAGKLISFSICQSGPASNIFPIWVFNHFVGGTENVLKYLPRRIDVKMPSNAYNQVAIISF